MIRVSYLYSFQSHSVYQLIRQSKISRRLYSFLYAEPTLIYQLLRIFLSHFSFHWKQTRVLADQDSLISLDFHLSPNLNHSLSFKPKLLLFLADSFACFGALGKFVQTFYCSKRGIIHNYQNLSGFLFVLTQAYLLWLTQ